jgi:hypothetical protein
MNALRLAILSLVLALAAPLLAADPAEHTVTIRARVPDRTGTVYIAGNIPALGPWDAGKFAMQGTGRERTAVLRMPHGTAFEFKFTLGAWAREAVGPSGTVMPNYRLQVDGDKEAAYDIVDFKKDSRYYIETWKDSGVLGRLEYWTDVKSKHLAYSRHVAVWLPPGYDEEKDRRYPVLYMHDGQNLFDPRMANTGTDWGIDEAVVRGVKAGRIPPVIVVGAFSTDGRAREYSPWDGAPDYARFLIEELMPRVNEKFRTLTGPANTAAMGSSMGGLLSFYLCWKRPDVFGLCGCVSTHFPYNQLVMEEFAPGSSKQRALPPGPDDWPLIAREIRNGARMPKGVRLYFDYGTEGLDAMYEPIQKRVDEWLVGQGFREGTDFVSRKVQGATHNEAAWRARMDDPLAFLFGKRGP